MAEIRRILGRRELARALALRGMLTALDPASQMAARLRDSAFLALLEQGRLFAFEDERGHIVLEPIVRH